MKMFPQNAFAKVDFVDHKIMSYNKSSAFKWFENVRLSRIAVVMVDFVELTVMSHKEFGIHGLKMAGFPRITHVLVDFVDHVIMLYNKWSA